MELVKTMGVEDLGELPFNQILTHYKQLKYWIDNKLVELEERIENFDDKKWIHFHKIINDKDEKIKEMREEIQNVRQEKFEKYENTLKENKALRRLLKTPSMLNA